MMFIADDVINFVRLEFLPRHQRAGSAYYAKRLRGRHACAFGVIRIPVLEPRVVDFPIPVAALHCFRQRVSLRFADHERFGPRTEAAWLSSMS